MKTLERPPGHFGVECARTNVVVSEVIKQRASNRRLANASFVRTNQYDCGFCHDALLSENIMVNLPPLVWRNHGQSEAKIWHTSNCGVHSVDQPRRDACTQQSIFS